jgi:DNA-binding NarL/FixJ family response regulator
MHHVCPDIARLAIMLDRRNLACRVADEMAALAIRETKSAAIQGTAALCRGLANDDIEALMAAVAAYQRAGRPLYQAQAYENAAVVLAKDHRPTRARAAFGTAVELYNGMDAAWDAGRAGQRLRQTGIRGGVSGPRRRPKTGWDALTPTERKVAALVAEGNSNPAIATRMFLSRRTVQSHVSSILGKLGLTSRVELAVIATARDSTEPPP